MVNLKILVIGESCRDVFYYCVCNRLCPEAPVPVVTPVEEKRNEGMAGNVVSNIKSLDSQAIVHLWTQKENIFKSRYIDKKTNHIFIRVDEGEQDIQRIQFTQNMAVELYSYDIVIVSDYNKGFLSDEDLIEIGNRAKLSILDTKRTLNQDILETFSFIKLNEGEAKANKDLLKKNRFLNKVLITLGNKGCNYLNRIYPSPSPQETIDVSGAGDTFTASFILKYFETRSMEKSIDFANQMASIVVSKRGVVTPK